MSWFAFVVMQILFEMDYINNFKRNIYSFVFIYFISDVSYTFVVTKTTVGETFITNVLNWQQVNYMTEYKNNIL